MNSLRLLVWIFPIIFIFHDFEEIIMIRSWLTKNKRYLSKKFPVLAKKILTHFDAITTPAFAAGVAEEFIILCIVCIISLVTNSYELWSGFFVAFALHLILHCIQALIIRKYIPALITSILCLPACFFIIKQIIVIIPVYTIAAYTVICFAIMAANLIAVHKCMGAISLWLTKFEKREN